jgi:hypothetical protein
LENSPPLSGKSPNTASTRGAIVRIRTDPLSPLAFRMTHRSSFALSCTTGGQSHGTACGSPFQATTTRRFMEPTYERSSGASAGLWQVSFYPRRTRRGIGCKHPGTLSAGSFILREWRNVFVRGRTRGYGNGKGRQSAICTVMVPEKSGHLARDPAQAGPPPSRFAVPRPGVAEN